MKPDMMVMLTTDSNIDRRIIQEADSLESAGWKVTIIAMPKTSKLFSNDERIIRLPFYSATEKNSVQLFLLCFYRWISKYLPFKSAVETLIRKIEININLRFLLLTIYLLFQQQFMQLLNAMQK
ncbi:MAG: hypothetical protein EB000_06235 [Alphaproteobacteria bacterium]|nr:hypothetical protein [Alphaproteobacteria bacterium]